ncbi:MAG TPA: hypothetical protein VGI84_02460 [Pseudonocardiaceae bacterium]|jgi:hypothetical protein
MTLVVLSVLLISLLVAVLAVFLFALGVLLGHTVGSLGDCAQSVRTIGRQANVIGPAGTRLNRSGAELADVLPLLHEDVDQLLAHSAVPASPASSTPDTASAPVGVGYLDT